MEKSDPLKVRSGIEEIPYYEPGLPIEEIKRRYGLERVIKLASNENPLGPSPLAVEAIKEFTPKVNRYPDAASRELRNALSRKLGVESEWIITGNGSVEIIQMVAETFINPGDRAILGKPSFLKYEKAIRIAQGVVVSVPTKDWTLDLDRMKEELDDNTRVVFIANPNNPTGTVLRRKEVERFLDGIPEHVLVVFDEAYYEYIEIDDFPDSIGYVKEGRNVLVLRTFSKIYGLAGLRVGYGIARPEVLRELNRVRETFNTSSIAQVAAIAALEDFEHVEMSKRMNREGRAFLIERLREMGLKVIPSFTNFVFVLLPIPGRIAFERLLKEGVIVRPMDFYGVSDGIRVTVGTPEENEIFVEALSKVLD